MNFTGLKSLRPRFSLRTLLFFVLMLGAGGLLYLRWEPWQVVMTLRPGGTEVINAFFSPDGKYIVTHSGIDATSANLRTVFWDHQGRELYRTEWCPNMGSGGIEEATFKLGSRYLNLTAAHQRRHSQMVNTTTFKMLFPESGADSFTVFSSDEKRCAAVFEDETRKKISVCVYDLEHGKKLVDERAAFDLIDYDHGNVHLLLSPDGETLAVSWYDSNIVSPTEHQTPTLRLLLCDVATSTCRIMKFKEFEDVQKLAFTSDSKRLTLFNDSSLIVVDVASLKTVYRNVFMPRYGDDLEPHPTVDYVLLKNQSLGLLKLTQPIIVRETFSPELTVRNTEISKHWLAWTLGEKLHLRNLLNGKEYSHVWAFRDSAETTWGMTTYEGIVCFSSAYKGQLQFDPVLQKFREHTFNRWVSPDRKREIRSGGDVLKIIAVDGEEVRATIKSNSRIYPTPIWSQDSQRIAIPMRETVWIYEQIRADVAYGVFGEPALWMTVLFAGGFLHSLWLGYRRRSA